VLVEASFDSEYAVALRRRGEAYEIFSVRPPTQLWLYQVLAMLKNGRMAVTNLDGRDEAAEQIRKLEATLPPDPNNLSLSRCAAPVDRETAAAIEAAWRRMLEAVRPDDEPSLGLDGTSYYFEMASNGGRPLAGETWSPREGTRPARLVRVAEEMRAYCESRNPARLRALLALARELGSPR
jgi:hypothetical protein